MPSLLQAWALPAALMGIGHVTTTWYNVVSKEVPEPYLDEIFHIPQTQKYCRGDWSWDPKITTPPGLYLVGRFLKPFLGCDGSSLRALNAAALCLICALSFGILRMLHGSRNKGQQEPNDKKAINEEAVHDDETVILDAHSALNIALFPVLFFFSALFYTDVMSTLVVLLSYGAYLRRSSAVGSTLDNLSAVVIGVLALFFRQTNIFWVAVFPAGLAVIDVLKQHEPVSKSSGEKDVIGKLRESWGEGTIYDCPVQEAGTQDYALFLASLAIAALRNLLLVIRAVIPYVVLLALFGAFVAWNGSVVLGDKSAHTATIHLPMMLYVFPYIALFSAPLLVGVLLQPVVPLLPKQLRKLDSEYLYTTSKASLPGLLVSTVAILGAMAAVHFNTIIHPYTLGDNRHYVFYIFKMLRQDPATKYLAVLVYYLCAWACIQTLGSSGIGAGATEPKRNARPTSGKAAYQPRQISFIIVWLATTALSLITTPLVEPRYFIIPWIIWRLHVPYTPASLSKDRTPGKASYDIRLVLETAWLLAINAAVTHTFLYKGFAWAGEPGNVQRFIW